MNMKFTSSGGSCSIHGVKIQFDYAKSHLVLPSGNTRFEFKKNTCVRINDTPYVVTRYVDILPNGTFDVK